MTETNLCGYCVDLPTRARTDAVEASRCPLCKAELGITRAGQRFRIGDEAGPRRRRSLLIAPALAGAAACSLAVCSLAAWWLVGWASAPVETVAVPPPAPYAKTPPQVSEPPAPTLPRDLAVAKPHVEGVLSPDARAKPKTAETVEAAAESPPHPATRLAQVHPKSLVIPAAITDEVELRGAQELQLAPEVALEQRQAVTDASDAMARFKKRQEATQQIAKQVQDILAKNEKKPDGFILSLREERPELAGLPFLLGKTCQLDETEARILAHTSLAIRQALTPPRQSSLSGSASTVNPPSTPYSFWGQMEKAMHNSKSHPMFLPGLMQILGPEPPDFRVVLVAQYRGVEGPAVTRALTRLALYDPEASVRADALHALIDRPAAESKEILLEGLRYPWAPVALRSADAIVFLQRRELIPDLIDRLDAVDATEAFETEVNGKQVTAVKELVKINHHRNCLLCHAPLDPKSAGTPAVRAAMPRGPVPSPYDPLTPPSSAAYYADRDGRSLARADVTYLRQDFSMMLPVEKADPWPKMQRFDFLIRTRVLTDDEVKALREARAELGPTYVSPPRQAILSALRRLTDLDAGSSAAGWRRAIVWKLLEIQP
jgi:hypothetical protein